MQPVFTLKANNTDITNAIGQRLISLRVTDESGIQSDSLEIVLDDRDNKLSLPPKGAELTLNLGYRGGSITPMGLFVVDELAVEGTPQTLTIRARAADFRQSLKEQQTRGWHQISIDSICKVIAEQHNLTPEISPAIQQQVIEHIDQTEESDLHFLTRLAKQYDAISIIKESRLIISPRGKGRSRSGRELVIGSYEPKDVSKYRFTMADRGRYVAAIAHWHNNKTGKREPVRVGEPGTPVYTLRGLQPDKEVAKVAAQTKLDSLKRGTVTGNITLPGDTRIRAEGKLTLSKFRPEIDGDWIVKRAEHTLGRQGFVTSMSVESQS